MAKLFTSTTRTRIRAHNEHLRLLTAALRRGGAGSRHELIRIAARDLYLAARHSRGRSRDYLFQRAEFYISMLK